MKGVYFLGAESKVKTSSPSLRILKLARDLADLLGKAIHFLQLGVHRLGPIEPFFLIRLGCEGLDFPVLDRNGVDV